MSLINLGNAITTHFGQTDQMRDLEEAITYYRNAFVSLPSGYPVGPSASIILPLS
jgi:hypothetical protein